MKNQTVYVVINIKEEWDESIIGIYMDKLKANRCKVQEEHRLKRLKWEDVEVLVRPWKLDD